MSQCRCSRSASAHPESRRPNPGSCAWHEIAHLLRVLAHKRVSPKEDLEAGIEGKESLQQILLGPEETTFDEKLLRILPGKVDVVDVHQHAGRECGQYLEDNSIDVAADFDRVGRIDEQQVPSAQFSDSKIKVSLSGAWMGSTSFALSAFS